MLLRLLQGERPSLGAVGPLRGWYRQGCDSLQQRRVRDHFRSEQNPYEFAILLSKGGEFTCRKIVSFETKARALAASTASDAYCSRLPVARKRCGFDRNAMNVEPVRSVKLRQLAKHAVDSMDAFGVIARRDVRFCRLTQRRRRVGELTENGLRAEHPDLTVLGDIARSADRMLEFTAGHATASNNWARSSGVRASTNGRD